MTNSRTRAARESGVALVTTVIILAVMAVVAVALMQGVTSDSYSARSVANYTRAKLAAEAGLAFASASLSRNMTNDTFVVVANTNRQLFVGNGVTNPPNSTDFVYTPVFSTVGSLTSPVTVITSGLMPTTNLVGGILLTNTNLPGGLAITSPPVVWTYMTNTNGTTNARFAFWVEDLGGRLDLSVVGTNDPTVARRPTGTNPAEIALWSLFNAATSNGVANSTAVALVTARSNVLTAATARLVDGGVTTNLLADLTANLRHDTNEPEVIPFGLGYADAGRPKFNLNTNISAAGVNAIATIINQNLPQFGSRGGAMAPAAYLNNIAASIVDYADTNSAVTVDSASPPAWRGVEAIPWPNEIFTRVYLEPADGRVFEAPNVKFKLTFQQFVEVWNLSDKPVTAGANCSISNNLDIPLRITNWIANLRSVDPTKTPQIETFVNSMTLPPNSYGILETAPRVFEFSVSTNLTGGSTNPPILLNETSFSPAARRANSVTFFVDGRAVSATPGGRSPAGATSIQLTPATGSAYTLVTAAALGTEDPTFSATRPYNLAGGDPRAQLFMSNLPAMGISYTNDSSRGGSTPGGRNRLSQAQGAVRTVEPELNWPDGGHSLGQAGADVGITPGSAGTAPSPGLGRAGATNHYLQKISDSGRFTNIVELGNIFDQMQWSDPVNPFHPLDSAAWMSLSTNATPFAGAGGRNSLRIGRPEHIKFATNGQRASELLDIFASGTNTTGPVVGRVAGRININTASTNALRALAAGVANSTDPALQTAAASVAGTNFFVPANAVSAFVAGVTNFRSQRPFSSASQLATITTNGNAAQWPSNAVFGNFGPTLDSSTYPVSAIRPFSAGNPAVGRVTEWNDEAAEEWFARVYPLATVRSRNFLVHVVGQALQTNGTTVLSTSKRAFQVYIDPIRATNGASSGLTTNSVPRVLATWDL